MIIGFVEEIVFRGYLQRQFIGWARGRGSTGVLVSAVIFGGANHDAGCAAASIYNNLSNLGPRLGFAYQLSADGKTSIRGGAGAYYQAPNTVAFEDVVGVPPFAPIVNISTTNFTNPYTAAGVSNPFPAEFGPSNPGASSTFPQDISFTQIFDRRFRLPQIFAYNLTFEHEFGSTWFVRMEYVGNRGTHLGGTGDQEAGLLQLNPTTYIPGESPDDTDNIQSRRRYTNFGFIDSINSRNLVAHREPSRSDLLIDHIDATTEVRVVER